MRRRSPLLAGWKRYSSGLRGRAWLMTAAVAATIAVVVVISVHNWQVKHAEDVATERMIAVVGATQDVRDTLTALSDAVMAEMSTTRPGMALTGQMEAAEARFDASLAHVGELVGDDPNVRSIYDQLMETRLETKALGERVLGLWRTGMYEEAQAVMESPDYFIASNEFVVQLELFLEAVQTSARMRLDESDASEFTALFLAAGGFLLLAMLWGAILVDWVKQSALARRAQTKLATLNNELEQRVEQRTAELERALTQAEQANRAKTEFLGAMSHELRTPLNGVLGMATVLERSGLSDDQTSMLEVIQTSGRNLLALLNDVLDYARLEAGTLQMRIEPFDLTEILERAVRLHKDEAETKGLDLTLDIAPEAAQVFVGDEVRVGQVAGNLISNAVKFTDEGSVTVSATRSDGRLRVAVRDTGCGVPKDRAHAIFDRFSQGDNSATRRHGGAGLGLALARELATAMGGDIGMDSTVNRGSEFWFVLPLEQWTPASEREDADAPEGGANRVAAA